MNYLYLLSWARGTLQAMRQIKFVKYVGSWRQSVKFSTFKNTQIHLPQQTNPLGGSTLQHVVV